MCNEDTLDVGTETISHHYILQYCTVLLQHVSAYTTYIYNPENPLNGGLCFKGWTGVFFLFNLCTSLFQAHICFATVKLTLFNLYHFNKPLFFMIVHTHMCTQTSKSLWMVRCVFYIYPFQKHFPHFVMAGLMLCVLIYISLF